MPVCAPHETLKEAQRAPRSETSIEVALRSPSPPYRSGMSTIRRPSSPARFSRLGIRPSCLDSISSSRVRTSLRTKSSAVFAYSRSSSVKSAPVNCGVAPTGSTSQLPPTATRRSAPPSAICHPRRFAPDGAPRSVHGADRGGRLAENPLSEAVSVDAEGLTDVLEAEDVPVLVRGEPGEGLPPQVECPPVGRSGVLEERPDAVLQYRQQEPALATSRFGTPIDRLVAHAHLAVKT